MTKHLNAALAMTLCLTLAACSKEDARTTNDQPDRASRVSDQHAPAGVVPGSHEDWCQEHAVPESQCTRCNPDLIAAFKATADWCEEHGLPESQCLACNPDLRIVRPPPAGSAATEE